MHIYSELSLISRIVRNLLEFKWCAAFILKAGNVFLPISIVVGDTNDLNLQLALQLAEFVARAMQLRLEYRTQRMSFERNRFGLTELVDGRASHAVFFPFNKVHRSAISAAELVFPY